MRHKSTLVFGGVALLAAVVASYVFLPNRTAGQSRGVSARNLPSPPPPLSDLTREAVKPPTQQSQYPQYADTLKSSHNYLDFANSTIQAAESGDRDAQYFLGKALRFCEGTYHMYFERKGEALTLDEALIWAARLHRSGAFVQTVYDRCHDLKEHNPAALQSTNWIQEAANAGQPAALATLAIDRFSKNAIQNQSTAAQPSSGNDLTADSRAALRAAVESKDPEVLWQIGVAQGFLSQDFGEKVKNEMAWWLVSCQRGYDCGPQADWLTLDCSDESFCTPGISGIDYIRNGSGADWPEVQLRAQDINAKLDAGKWRELGLEM